MNGADCEPRLFESSADRCAPFLCTKEWRVSAQALRKFIESGDKPAAAKAE